MADKNEVWFPICRECGRSLDDVRCLCSPDCKLDGDYHEDAQVRWSVYKFDRFEEVRTPDDSL